MMKHRPVKYLATEVEVNDMIRVGKLWSVDKIASHKNKSGKVTSVTFYCTHATLTEKKSFTFKAEDEVKVRCVNPDYKPTAKPKKVAPRKAPEYDRKKAAKAIATATGAKTKARRAA